MAGPARVAVDLPPLSPQQQAQMKALETELRCLVCQNQTLADSGAELAGDLRNQVHKLIAQGMTDAQVKQYLVDRYGDFVLYRPPVQSNTLALWAGPFAMLAVGGVAFAFIQRRQRLRRAQAADAPAEAASQASLDKARQLLDP
ncbi:MAG: cytochrome c-type biogenesis protein [Burkholderiaceae bacterium]